ncbi:Translation initiation factor IF2/IF5 [uncultured virus]|nr:Translation initiation factor IF2/IF5 [uncultured virus]
MENNTYEIEFLVNKLYNELDANKTENKTENKKLIIPRPEVVVANKKTCIQNFGKICEKLNRKMSDVQAFFDTELRIKSSINSEDRLIIPGIFRLSGIQNILINYIKNFLECKECGATNTFINKENRINFIKCNICLSQKSIN